MWLLTVACSSLLVFTLLCWKIFVVPHHLRHIPRVPILPLLKSYISGEVEEQRIRNVTLPWALENGHSVVLVWMFGLWFVHILDPMIGKATMDDRHYVRQLPPQEMLFWQFTGKSNIFFTEGEEWKRHSRQLKKALQGRIPPIADFVRLSRKALQKIEDAIAREQKSEIARSVASGGFENYERGGPQGVLVPWDELLHRFTLDVVGSAILGYDFRALDDPNTPFVNGYKASLASLTSPPYMFIPKLEKILPRKSVKEQMLALREKFREVIEHKRLYPGDDFISHLSEEKELRTEEMVDNVVVLFIAGHDTTAAALSSFVYFLAKHPQYQRKAREEVFSILGSNSDPTVHTLSRMPYLDACIKESLRMNNPSNWSLPRISRTEPTVVGGLQVPPRTPVVFNIAAIHRNDAYWANVEEFNPERFLPGANRTSPATSPVSKAPFWSQNHHEDKGEGGDTTPCCAENPGFVSFGAGPRQCPAKSFSLYEQRVMGALLLREYEWTLPIDSAHQRGLRNRFTFSALNSPQDLEICFMKRS